METSREDVSIAIRSAFLRRDTKQRFSLIILVVLSIALLVVEKIETKPLNYFRSVIKDGIYRGSLIVSSPAKGINFVLDEVREHFNIYNEYKELKEENIELKSRISNSNFLELENTQLRKLIEEDVESPGSFVSARVMLDKKSPYLKSFILNSGSNKGIKNGMAVLHKKNFVGRIVDVNFFSSRVLLVSDLNSKIPVVIEPSGYHAILSGHNDEFPTLEFLPENHSVQFKDIVYTSGKEGIFLPGLPIGEARIESGKIVVSLFSDLSQITFVNIMLGDNN